MALKTIRRGLDLPISGTPVQQIESAPVSRTLALVAGDYIGMKPTMLVQEGDRVLLGQPVFEDKKTPGVLYTAPASGKVQAINRGAKRSFQSLVIEVDGDESVSMPDISGRNPNELTRQEVVDLLVSTGLWPALRTRPYSKVPSPEAHPHSLFVQAIDTSPLAPDSAKVIDERAPQFERGLMLLKHLTKGALYLCTAAGVNLPGSKLPGITHAEFDGPHPAGLPGTHIHLLDPVGPGKSVWYINYQDVIAIGELGLTNRLSADRVISLAGPQVENPRLIKTRWGASLEDICQGQLKPGENRIISGSVLSGRALEPKAAHLGRYHLQVSVILEGRDREFLGWQKPGFDKFSVKRVYAAGFAADGRRFSFTTNRNGSSRAMVPIGMYEQVMPLDILPTFLLRSLIIGDTDQAQALGALELDEEDLALCTFVCPGKYNYGPLLRKNLNLIEKEG